MSPSTHREHFDAVVVGGGPAGSATAWHLKRAGLSVLILERERFPRFHIGESLTGTAGDFIRDFGLTADMERLDFPVKPGVKVLGHDAKSEFYVPVLRPTWQVQRAQFDELLLERARAAGAEHRLGSARGVVREGERVAGVTYVTLEDERDPREVRCRAVVDASGQSMFLSSQGVAGPRRVDAFSRQIAIHCQLDGVARDDGDLGNATVIFYDEPLHWAWMIPVSSTLVSIGVVLPVHSYKQYGGSPEAVFEWSLENLSPDLARRTRGARRTDTVRVSRNYSYRADPFVGPGWLCVGDSYRFTDPIFSFGVSFALTSALEASSAVVEILRGGDEDAALARYARHQTRGHDAAAELIRYFWKFPAFFSYMTRGDRGRDIIRLLAGDCFEDPPLSASLAMRRSLCNLPALDALEGRARTIAERVHQRYDFFQGVDAAYIDPSAQGIRLWFHLGDDDIDLYDSIHDFEEELIADVGRDDLAILSFTPEMSEAAPSEAGAMRIFDRRARG